MLRYAKNPNLGKWPKVTSLVVHSQCLSIYFYSSCTTFL